VKAVVQRVARASVTPGGSIGPGLCILLGIAAGDVVADAVALAEKIAKLRIFENDDGRFDRSLLDTGGDALVVSQFTLLAVTAKGNRPSFSAAARAPRSRSAGRDRGLRRAHGGRARERRTGRSSQNEG
jgi:D-aminoacyl-tRNA deacylase